MYFVLVYAQIHGERWQSMSSTENERFGLLCGLMGRSLYFMHGYQ